MENTAIGQLELILLIGAIVAIIARRFKVPYTVGLVVAGIVLAFVPLGIEIPFSKGFIFNVLLPPLIFEAALYIHWRKLKKDLLPVVTFATIGVLLSAGVTAAFMHYLIGWDWQMAILFGVLIAATDPVSVIATFKEAKVEGRLRLLVESESLFNDSTAAVAFVVALSFATGESLSFGSAALLMVKSVIGGIVSGLIVGGFALLIAGRTEDHLVELSLTTIAAFGSFWLAEHFHLSGVLATMTAGLMVGNTQALGFITEKGEQAIESFWEYAAFVVNSVVFIILGINEAYQNFANVIVPIAVAIIAVIVGRAIAIYPISALFSRSRWKIDSAHQHIMFWGGLRGALALALALGIPETVPYRGEILTVTFGVVAFSVFAQGLTMTPLLGWLGQLPKAEKA
ncbi:MAG: sodium:proton antiporter [Acidobacteria bacterium]|jgi:CPA1 family monovalent cation:H+ antiporter|nr:sodium:proton antiporter [Acidobacteriota bacterium]